MGQEKSLPVRCNSTNQNYRTSSISSTSVTSVVSSSLSSSSSSSSSTSSSLSSSTSSVSRPPSSNSSRSSYKSLERQSKYLSEHLYIKSYLDIVEEDRNAKKSFRPAPPGGIRNYKPKIITEKQKQIKQEVDVWI